MRFDEFIQAVGTELQELLWQDVPERNLGREIEQLEEAIRERTEASARQKAVVDRLKRRIADDELQAAWLTERVEVYLHINDRPNAWQHALQLDQARQTIATSRAELQHRQRAYSDELIHIRRLYHRQARLRDQLAALQ
jgi:hypothetical protein